MRRLVSIFFLFLFLLYHVGYLSIYWLANHQIDNYWSTLETIEQPLQKISIKASLPYWADQQEYLPATGSFTVNGKIYRAIYQKYANDSLHFLVVQDMLTTHLQKSVRDWVRQATSNTAEKEGKTSFKTIVKDFQLNLSTDNVFNISFEYLPASSTLYAFNAVTFIPEISSPPPRA